MNNKRSREVARPKGARNFSVFYYYRIGVEQNWNAQNLACFFKDDALCLMYSKCVVACGVIYCAGKLFLHHCDTMTCTDPAAAAAAAAIAIGAPTAVALCVAGRVCPALSRALTICGQGHVLQGLQVRVRCEV